MIIDLILDRAANDADIANGYTHARLPDGNLIPLAYNPRKFYYDVLRYGEVGEDITAAMDYGEEPEVVASLCRYVIKNGYNPEICVYIRSVKWLN